MRFWLFIGLLVGGTLMVTVVALALIPLRGRSERQRAAWYLAGYFTPAVLTVGTAMLAERTSFMPDKPLVLLGFGLAVAVVLVGHFRTPDRPAWWLGAAGVALGWCVAVGFLIWLLSQIGPDF